MSRRLAKSSERKPEHLFIETDGQVYLIRDGGTLRFPRAGERLPFRVDRRQRMVLDDAVVTRAKPLIKGHPEDWLNRDAVFTRGDVDGLVKHAIYLTMMRLVSEVALVRGGRVLMVKARRGFSKGHWNLPGGFMDFGEPPEAGAEREVEEEIGADVRLEGLLGVYISGFPGKPTYTLGFVWRGRCLSDRFHLKEDEIEAADWFTIDRALTMTRNPFANWGLVELFRQLPPKDITFRVHRHGLAAKRKSARDDPRPVVFLDRDGVINAGRRGYIRTPRQFEFLDGAVDAMKRLVDAGRRIVIVSNQDAMGWKLISTAQVRRIHEKMLGELKRAGVTVDEIYYCPHNVLSDCACRKPRPGMLLAAARELDANPRTSWMVGDKVSDVWTGKHLGSRTVFVGDARRRKRFAKELEEARPEAIAANLREAVTRCLGVD